MTPDPNPTVSAGERGGHTPGPWVVAPPCSGFSAITTPDGRLIFGLASGGAEEKLPDATCEANARLIAAAPTLLGALIAVRARFQDYRLTPDTEAVIDRVNAAISRATHD